MRVHQRPGRRKPGMLAALQQPHPRHDEQIMRIRMTQLMPPILTDDLGRVDLVDRPQVAVAALVQEDGLEDVRVKGLVGRELALVVGAVEAHLDLSQVLRVHLDVVHGLEGRLGELEARRLRLVG